MKRNYETEQYMKRFEEITKVKPIRCKLQTGSMKKLIFVEIEGTEEEYKNIQFYNDGYMFNNLFITFKDFNHYGGKDKIRFHIEKERLK